MQGQVTWDAQEEEDSDDLDEIIDQVTDEVFGDGAPESLVVKKVRSSPLSTTAKSPVPVGSSSAGRVFASATFPGPFASQRPVPRTIS